jgi:hypothetical protein
VEQNRLHQIIARVTRDHRGMTGLHRDVQKKPIASGSRRRFEICAALIYPSSKVVAANDAPTVERSSHARDMRGIGA